MVGVSGCSDVVVSGSDDVGVSDSLLSSVLTPLTVVVAGTFAGGVESTSGSTLGDSDFFWGDVGSIVVVSGSEVVDSGSLLAGQPDATMMQKVATIAVCQIILAQLL